ncbi:MAG: hypothetical protein IM466_04590 [Microcystis sp. M04BS1]|nr:hypothetical protein [Microcystis sp. M04BS1]
MSKVISFSISDRYLDKIRSLYPDLTDNLAAKKALIDGLDDKLDDKLDDGIKTLIESSLSSSLDDRLDAKLDDKVKPLIESWVDGLLEVRLDATVGKLITSLSERLSRLEERLDGSLDDGLDDMDLLLRMQQEASIATSPIPNQEPGEPATAIEFLPLPPSPDVIDGSGEAIETVPTVETGEDAIETVTDSKPWYTIDELLDCHYPGWPETKEGLRKKAKREHWPKRTQRGSKGNPYEYQAVLPE